MRPTARVLTRRGWSLAGAALGLALAGRLLGTVELWILTTGIALLLVTSMAWARTRRPSRTWNNRTRARLIGEGCAIGTYTTFLPCLAAWPAIAERGGCGAT